MKLEQYERCLRLLSQSAVREKIQEETGLSFSTIQRIANGARIAPHLLLQVTGLYERCPICGQRVLLPCLRCFFQSHPDATCVEPIPRPERNQLLPLSVTLDEFLLEGDTDDEEDVRPDDENMEDV